MDFGRTLKDQLRQALETARAHEKASGARGTKGAHGSGPRVTFASAVNVGGHSTSVASDGNTTVVNTDGVTRVVRHSQADPTAQDNDQKEEQADHG